MSDIRKLGRVPEYQGCISQPAPEYPLPSRRAALGMLVGAGALLTGCGGGGSSPTPVQLPGPTPTPTPTPTAFFDPEYGTRFVDSSKTTIWPQIYIDPFNGRDGADGTTKATALRTKAGLLAHPLMGPAGTPSQRATVRGVTIGIVGNATAKIREQFDFFNPNAANGYRLMEACSWVRVGFDPVQGDCTDIASPSGFSPRSGGFAVNWQHDLHEVGVCRFRVFIQGRPLRRVATESQVGPGTYWYAGLPELGVAKAIVFADFDGADPRTSGRSVEITARDVFISCRGGVIEGIFAERNGHNSGSLIIGRDITQTADPSSLRAVLVYEGTKHNAVFGHGDHLDLIAVNCRDSDFDPDGEIATLLTLAQRDLGNERASLTRCIAIADTSIWGASVPVGQNSSHAFLTHDTNAGGGLTSLSLVDCGSVNLAAGWDCGSARQTSIQGHYSPLLTSTNGAASHISGAANYPIDVKRSLLGGSNGLYRWVDNTNVKVTSSALLAYGVFSGGGLTTLGRNGTMVVEDTFLIANDNVAPPFIDIAAGSLTTNRNIEVGAFNVFVAGSATAVASDSNVHRPFTGGTFYCTVGSKSFTLPEWKASSGKDVNTVSIASAAEAGFTSGNYPTAFAPDLNLVAGGKAAITMQNPLTPSEVSTMQARPKSLAEAKAYLLNSSPSRRAVRE